MAFVNTPLELNPNGVLTPTAYDATENFSTSTLRPWPVITDCAPPEICTRTFSSVPGVRGENSDGRSVFTFDTLNPAASAPTCALTKLSTSRSYSTVT